MLADPRTVVIATGQQAGAFGGPLFTLLKAVTAIQLAAKVSADHGVPAVPVFWVDAEDHDWEEVRGSTVLDGDFQPRTITLANPEGAGELPVAQLRLDDRIVNSVRELLEALPGTDFTEQVAAGIRAAYRPNAGMSEAFSTWIESVLGPHGLVVFEAADPAAKPLAAPVFRHELESPAHRPVRAPNRPAAPRLLRRPVERSSPRAATSRRLRRSRAASACFTSTAPVNRSDATAISV